MSIFQEVGLKDRESWVGPGTPEPGIGGGLEHTSRLGPRVTVPPGSPCSEVGLWNSQVDELLAVQPLPQGTESL